MSMLPSLTSLKFSCTNSTTRKLRRGTEPGPPPFHGHRLRCYHIETEDWYDDIREDVPTKYDTSAYPKDHPAGLPRMNKKLIGMMNDELKERTMIKFCGNRAKSYSYVVGEYAGSCKKSYCDCCCEDGRCIGNGGKRCKGINKGVIKKHLIFEDFEACALGKVSKTVEQMHLISTRPP